MLRSVLCSCEGGELVKPQQTVMSCPARNRQSMPKKTDSGRGSQRQRDGKRPFPGCLALWESFHAGFSCPINMAGVSPVLSFLLHGRVLSWCGSPVHPPHWHMTDQV